MASMVFASSSLSAQSFVKLGTNSNYSHPSCYVPRVKNSCVHLSYKNISHIEFSKSLFTKGDGNFSFSSPKFPRVASTYSPSLNIIKALGNKENVYHYTPHASKTEDPFQLGDKYRGMILLIVNIPQQGSKHAKEEIEFLNDLRRLYDKKISSFGRGFEVLGFFHDMEDLNIKKSIWPWSREKEEKEIIMEKAEIRKLADFPIFEKVKVNDNQDNLWNFLRKSENIEKIEQDFEKFLVDGNGIPVSHFLRFDGETLKPKTVKPGEFPGDVFGSGSGSRIDPTSPVKNAIDEFHWRDDTE